MDMRIVVERTSDAQKWTVNNARLTRKTREAITRGRRIFMHRSRAFSSSSARDNNNNRRCSSSRNGDEDVDIDIDEGVDVTTSSSSRGRRRVTATIFMAIVSNSVTSSDSGDDVAEALELAPLGKPKHIGGEKRVGIEVASVREILERDLRPVRKVDDGSSTYEGAYFVTGDLTPEIFADDCAFIDPTNTTRSLSKYVNALKILFDAENSQVLLRTIEVIDDHTIVAEYACEGYLKLPWHPRVKPYVGTVTWKTNDDGLIIEQNQKWTGVTAAGAILESFTPSM